METDHEKSYSTLVPGSPIDDRDDDQTTSGSSPAATARWNPTKEQISVLEALYSQGVRTPTTEQIQQIAAKLRQYGSIEGKNVFYWFQNHKARQRQKQKQEGLAYLGRFLRRVGPVQVPAPLLPRPAPDAVVAPVAARGGVVFPSPPPQASYAPNVVCRPYYIAAPGLANPGVIGYCPVAHQLPPILLPTATPRQTQTEAAVMPTSQITVPTSTGTASSGYCVPPPPNRSVVDDLGASHNTSAAPVAHETLQLFPQHPTGILQERWSPISSSFDWNASEELSLEEDGLCEGEGGVQQNRPVLCFL